MRGEHRAWRAAVALVTAVGIAVSTVGCAPPPVGEADPRPAAEVEPNDTLTPSEADATRPPVREPEPRTTPKVEVNITRPPVEIDGARTACSPQWDRPEWLFRDFVQWTADGSTVLFTDGPHIYKVAADGSRLWDVIVPAPPTGKQAGPMVPFTVSPDGEQVIYASCDYGRSYELARVGVDGTQPQQLTFNNRFESHPAWSPDGRRIAYLAAAQVSGGASDLRPRLYTMAPDGSDVRPVRMAAAAELLPLPPQWSPDSKHIAYTQREVGGRVGLYTVAVDGGASPQRLSAAVSGASWSPDGTRIAFAKPDPEEDAVALYTIAADGTDLQRVATITGWRPHYGAFGPTKAWIEILAWSPDGSNILYSCRGTCVVDPDDAPVGPVPLHVAGRLAAWSLDGSRIASVHTSGPDPDIPRTVVVYTVAPDGSDVRTLVVQDKEGDLQSADDLRQAEIAACSAGTAVPNPADYPDLVRDCETLLRARDALRGTAELNWTSSRPLDQWDGLDFSGWPRRLIVVSLSGRRLTGGIPPELGDLTNLRRLELNGNSLVGAIPPELGQLAQLARLDLSYNSLTGGIPHELGALTRLAALHLSNNNLEGPMPPALGRLPRLTSLLLANNQLTGPIPAAICQSANLERLALSGNELTGCGLP